MAHSPNPDEALYPKEAFSVFCDGLDHPEGLAFDDEQALWAGGELGQIYRIDPSGQSKEIARLGGFCLGLAFSARQELWICNSGLHALMKVDRSGKVLQVIDRAGDRPLMTPNFSVFDHEGNLYFSDSGEWSDNALRDAAWFIHQSGLSGAGYFRKGEWTRAKMSEAFRKVNLGAGVASGRFAMFSTPELREVGRRIKDFDVFTYSYLAGLRNALAPMLVALAPLPERWSVGLLRNVFRRNRLPVDGFVAVQILGCSQGRQLAMNFRIVYRDRRDYWINGLVLATAARIVSEGEGVRAGVHFLADAVDPIAFMTELRKAGVEQVETVEQVACPKEG